MLSMDENIYICIMERWDFRDTSGSDLRDLFSVIDNVFLLISYLWHISSSHSLVLGSQLQCLCWNVLETLEVVCYPYILHTGLWRLYPILVPISLSAFWFIRMWTASAMFSLLLLHVLLFCFPSSHKGLKSWNSEPKQMFPSALGHF